MCSSIPLITLNGQFASVILQNSSKVILEVPSSVFSSHEDFRNLRTDLHFSDQSPCFTSTLIHAHCIHSIPWLCCPWYKLPTKYFAIHWDKITVNADPSGRAIMYNRLNGLRTKVMCNGLEAEEDDSSAKCGTYSLISSRARSAINGRQAELTYQTR